MLAAAVLGGRARAAPPEPVPPTNASAATAPPCPAVTSESAGCRAVEAAPRSPKFAGLVRVGYAIGGSGFIGLPVAATPTSPGGLEKVSTGGGLDLSVGVAGTPIWVRPRVGLGGSVELGWKYDATGLSNPDLTLQRFPLVMTVHVLARASEQIFVLGGGGIDKEFGLTFHGPYGSGQVRDQPLSTGLGAVVQLGGLLALSRRLALEALLRYTRVSYEGAIDASNVELSVGTLWGP
jgi:hypothetical protein